MLCEVYFGSEKKYKNYKGKEALNQLPGPVTNLQMSGDRGNFRINNFMLYLNFPEKMSEKSSSATSKWTFWPDCHQSKNLLLAVTELYFILLQSSSNLPLPMESKKG